MKQLVIKLFMFVLSILILISCKPSTKTIPIINKTSSVIIDRQKQNVIYNNYYLNDNNNFVYVFEVTSNNNDLLKDILSINEFRINKNKKGIFAFGNNLEVKSEIGNNFIIYLNNEKIESIEAFNNTKIDSHDNNSLEIEILIYNLFNEKILPNTKYLSQDYTQELLIEFYNYEVIILIN